MSLRDELQAIYDQHGRLTAGLVVEVARPKRHPLHDRVFDRPPKEAAEAWYEQRAHDLIRSVRVVYKDADETGPERSVRAYHAMPSPSGFVYEPAESVAVDPFQRQLLLRQMERDWRALQARYGMFTEFAELVANDLAA